MFTLDNKDVELKSIIESKIPIALGFVNELCSLFNLVSHCKGWEYGEYVFTLNPPKDSHNPFEIRIKSCGMVYFVDHTRTGVSSNSRMFFMPEELIIDHSRADDRVYRDAWVDKAKLLLGVKPSFSGNCGYGPYIHMKFPVTDKYSKNIVGLLKQQGVTVRIVG